MNTNKAFHLILAINIKTYFFKKIPYHDQSHYDLLNLASVKKLIITQKITKYFLCF